MTSPEVISSLTRVDIPTREGTAQVRALRPDGGVPREGTLLLGHGAGGHADAADVLALTDLAGDGWTVVLVDQPWRVAGKKVATRPPTLDIAWRDIVGSLADGDWQERHTLPLPRPWVYGGRSAGARVACRTSVDEQVDEQVDEHGEARPGAAGVVCLAFPLHPPGKPERSRAHELALPVAAGLPTLVVQGRLDPFGSPAEIRAAVHGPSLTLQDVTGSHSPSRDLAAVRGHVADFLGTLTDARCDPIQKPRSTPR
ncbi:MAG: hypothetical protein Q4P07_01860 [Ornithinimicrobium sp.]|uniref:alpha/beta hydrolase family protein n=1 Tax=Ornithinimicrobium sp. TaxID=1977084 RepID=UPI0026DF71FD|nr:alpha/beta family hydrolase [Ornithinimicrobium sp.]MDO5738879.1 hypothetical protein [Ornithinimicrobium sp.]